MNTSSRNRKTLKQPVVEQKLLLPCIPLITGFALITVACLVAKAGEIVNIIFPVGAMLVAMYLLRWDPFLYIGFNWWLYFLAPFVRRVADWGGGFTDPSPILLAPYLASLTAIFYVLKHFSPSKNRLASPFLLSGSGVVYAFCIGALNSELLPTCISLLDWFVPIVFGLYIFLQWQEYPAHRENFKRIFLWGVLVMGSYGIIQFLVCPPWEIYWFQNSPFGGQGRVEALNMRVYSTMNSVEPFSAYMSYGLLSLVSTASPLVLPASILGGLTFLLTQGRSAWLAWVLGMAMLTNLLPSKQQARLVIGLFFLSLCLIPLATMEPFSSLISERLSTFSSVETDGSALARQAAYADVLNNGLFNVVGSGFGAGALDSAILTWLTSLGWIGSIPYATGVFLLVHELFSSHLSIRDTFFISVKAATASSLLRLLVNNPTTEISGIVFWGFLGIGLAAVQYARTQQQDELRKIYSPKSYSNS